MGCMHGYAYACVFITIAASISLVSFGMLTNRWLSSKTSDEFTVKLPIWSGAFHMHVKTRVNVEVKMALTKACILVDMTGKLSLDNVPGWLKGIAQGIADRMMDGKPKYVRIHNCVEKSTKFNGPNADKIRYSLRHFKYIFICLALGMLLLLASLVVTLVKSPCTRYYKKRKMHLAVMILLLGAAIPLFSGVMIANKEFNGNAPFVDLQVAHNKAKFNKMFLEESVDTSGTETTRAAKSLRDAVLKHKQSSTRNSQAHHRLRRSPNPDSVSLSSTSLSLPSGLKAQIISRSFQLTHRRRLRRSLLYRRSRRSTPSRKEQFNMVWDTTIANMKDSMQKGYSFTITFVGVILVFVAFALACLEFYFSSKDCSEDNESGDAYVLSDRSSDASMRLTMKM